MPSICGVNLGCVQAQGFGPCSHPLFEHVHTHYLTEYLYLSRSVCSMLNWFRRRTAVLPSRCRVIVSKLLVLAGSPARRDGALIEECSFFFDGWRWSGAVQSIASDHFRLLGSGGPNDPPLLSKKNFTNFETRLEALGWILGTEKLTVSRTLRNLEKLQRLPGECPVPRQTATVRQVYGLTSFPLHAPFAMRPGKFSVGQLSAAVRMPQSAFPSGLDNPNGGVTLGPDYDEHQSWRWFVDEGLASGEGGTFIAHVQYYHSSTPKLTIFTDSSQSAFGGYCLQTGHFFRHELSVRRAVSCLWFEQTRYWL